jgi:hypothetical protein
MRSLFYALAGLMGMAVAAQGEGLLIVAPRAFSEALQDFAAAKRTTIPTEVVTLEEIVGSTAGVDDAEKVKRFLYNRWRTGKLAYVLLAGDADVLPVRYMVLDRVTPAAFDYAFYPSDLYYADLAKADGSFEGWNRESEGFHAGYFGEVRGEKNKEEPINFDQIDYLPEVAVGRWPVSTAEEAKAVAAKSLAGDRQRASAGSAQRTAALIATTGWVDTRQHFDSLQNALGDSWQTERRLFGREGKDRPTRLSSSSSGTVARI